MSPPSISQTLPKPGSNLGLKLILICGLILLMAIPAMFISYISYERAGRADDVTREVSERYGGAQSIMGPLLVAPYHVKNKDGETVEAGDYVTFAETGHAEFSDVKTTIRKRSLFKVPTYQGQGVISASFAPIPTLSNAQAKAGPGMFINWDAAQLVISVTDVRGLKSDITIKDDRGVERRFEPATAAFVKVVTTAESIGRNHASTPQRRFTDILPGRLMSVDARGFISADKNSAVTIGLNLGGAQSLSVMPFARTTTARIKSDWADPGFSGAFPPVERDVTEDGFDARWSVPRLARNMPASGLAHQLPLHEMSNAAMRVSFIETHSAYKTVNRALKYAVLFIGLVFLAYFLFEVIVGVSVHPAQYILIGLAQSIFYLLLLAFSEHIGFNAAFVIAAGATIAATAGYAGAVFGSRDFIVKTGVVFTLVYGLLFTLMRMQDFALMLGALTSFIAIAGTMYLTRSVNWYGRKEAR
ncbi:cell envelope integrity protein CreD [Fretibacter rubidus]|uniref:cell envelope integrity protein CreD n=1 Tax=Fretibacter rubidus TaxID=570162 RepID=UPI00352B4556